MPRIDISTKDLPSRGVPYPSNATLSYSSYSYGEISDFSDSKLSVLGIVEFMEGGINFSEGVDNLTYEDFWYVALLRKLSSLGTTDYKVEFKCSACKKVAYDVFNQVGFDDLKVDDLPLITELQGKEVEFNLITLGQYKDLLRSGKLNSSALLAKATNLPFEEAYELIYNAQGEDLEVLQEIDLMLYHSISKHQVKCSHCDHPQKIDLTNFKESIIRPFRAEARPNAARIRIGKGRAG